MSVSSLDFESSASVPAFINFYGKPGLSRFPINLRESGLPGTGRQGVICRGRESNPYERELAGF